MRTIELPKVINLKENKTLQANEELFWVIKWISESHYIEGDWNSKNWFLVRNDYTAYIKKSSRIYVDNEHIPWYILIVFDVDKYKEVLGDNHWLEQYSHWYIVAKNKKIISKDLWFDDFFQRFINYEKSLWNKWFWVMIAEWWEIEANEKSLSKFVSKWFKRHWKVVTQNVNQAWWKKIKRWIYVYDFK